VNESVVVAFGPVVPIWLKEPAPVFLSILYPSSPVALSVHVRLICPGDVAEAERFVGVKRDESALYALILPPVIISRPSASTYLNIVPRIWE
jgi:hypothetical protein